MPGSMDDHQVHVVNASEETVLTVLVYPDGKTTLLCSQPPVWIADVLRRIADTQAPADRRPFDTKMAADEIELARAGTNVIIEDLKRAPELFTTQQIVDILGRQGNLSVDEHRLILAATAAVLLERVVSA